MRLSKIAADPGRVNRSAGTRSPAGVHPALHLQRSAGNRAVTSLITAAPPVQRVKSGEEEAAGIKAGLHELMDGSDKELYDAVRRHHNLEEHTRPTSDQVWQYACAVYEAHRAKGAGYWATLTRVLAERSPTSAEAEKQKAEAYDRRFATEYRYAGRDGTPSPESFVGAKGQSATANWPYHNRVSADDGWITALHNDKDDDQNKAKLPNSEILWQQFKGIVPDQSSLNGITRSSIVNVATLVTVYMAYPNGAVPDNNPREWAPGTEEFFAVLGTENAKSAAFLLIDHAHVLGKTISAIRTTRNSIEVPFAPVPGS